MGPHRNQTREADLKRPREQQEAQQAVEQHLVEVDAGNKAPGRTDSGNAAEIQSNEDHRDDERLQHQADRGSKLEEPAVHIREQCRQDHQDGDNAVSAHGETSQIWPSSEPLPILSANPPARECDRARLLL